MGSGTDLAKLPRVRGRTRCYPWPMEAMEGGFSDALAIWNAVGTVAPSAAPSDHVPKLTKPYIFRGLPISTNHDIS